MMTKMVGLAALFTLLLGPAAHAQSVITPDTEPSQQTVGGKDAKPPSSATGAGTVQGREMSNGSAPGGPDPAAGSPKPGR